MENKIEFNWEKYQSGEYDCITRDGRKVEQLVKFEDTDDKFPIAGVVNRNTCSYTIKGSFTFSLKAHSLDLFLIPKEEQEPSGLYTMTENGLVKGYADSNNGFDISQLTNVSIGTGVNTIPKIEKTDIVDTSEPIIPELKGVFMEVSDYEDFKTSSKLFVLGKYEGDFICSGLSHICTRYKYARPIIEVKECWVNVFEGEHGLYLSPYTYSSKNNAMGAVNCKTYIKTIKIDNQKDGE